MLKINKTCLRLLYAAFPLLFFISSGVLGQEQQAISLSEQLEGKKKLNDIMEVVEQYYAHRPEKWRGPNGDDPTLKHWYRWHDYMSARLKGNGDFANISKLNSKATVAMNKMKRSDSRTINAFWQFIGPNNTPGGTGRVDRIAFHPTDPDVIYVGTPAGGLWYSGNNGDTWVALSDHVPSTGISGIVVSHSDPYTVYMLTGDGDSNTSGLVEDFGYMRSSVGVLKSGNSGVSWYETGTLPENDTVYTGYKLIQDPNNENTLIAATSIGIFKTEDGAWNWEQSATGRFFDVEYKPGSSDTVYAVTGNTFFISVDGGDSFNDVSSYDIPIQSVSRLEIGVTPADPDRVYLLCGGVIDVGQFSGLYRSLNSGYNFTQMVDTPNILGYGLGTGAAAQVSYDLCMDVSPTDPNVVYTGGIRVWRSTNGGALFSHIHDGHEDTHDVKVNPLSGYVFKATDGGIYRSTDGGDTWEDKFIGMGTLQFYNLSMDRDDFQRLAGGTQDNGVQMRYTSSTTFERLVSGDGYDAAFAAGRDSVYSTRNTQVYLNSDNGSMSHTIFTPDSAFFGSIVTHNIDPNIVFLGKGNVYRSYDAGANWDTLSSVAGFWDMSTCPSNSSRLYTAGGSSPLSGSFGFWRTDNLGDSWVPLHSLPGFPEQDSMIRITEIGVRPNNSNHVWITNGGFVATHKVFYSDDAGVTWENKTDNLPNTIVNCIAVTASNAVYIGTDIGVFYRTADMDEWMPWSNNLPNTPVTELLIGEDKIVAATFGRGVWRSNVAEECVDALVIPGQLEGKFHFEADVSISSTAEIYHGAGTDVTFKGGQRVILLPGFRARRLAEFTAYIGGCGEGGIPD